jgi:hypothetical protein
MHYGSMWQSIGDRFPLDPLEISGRHITKQPGTKILIGILEQRGDLVRIENREEKYEGGTSLCLRP